MANPWLKKNPFMSLWLSGANKIAGSMRGQVAAQARRQADIATKTAATQMVDFWTNAQVPPATTKRKKRA